MFSLIFLVHTTLLLGQGHLTDYGIDSGQEREACQNELFRAARLVQQADRDGQRLSDRGARALEQRIEDACYNGESPEGLRGE